MTIHRGSRPCWSLGHLMLLSFSHGNRLQQQRGTPQAPRVWDFRMIWPDSPIFSLPIHTLWPSSPLTLHGQVPAETKAGVSVAIKV